MYALGACAAYQVALGVYFVSLRPAFLPEDERATGAGLAVIVQVAPGFEAWIKRVLIVLGGQAAASGVLLALALVLLRNGASSRAAVALFVGAGGCSVVLMSAVNFFIHSDFRWVLVVPVLTWAVGVGALWLEGLAGSKKGHLPRFREPHGAP